MDRLPPKIVRRLILAPLAFVLCLLLLAVSPILLALAAIADLFLPGDRRTLRLVAYGVAYLAFEVVGLIVMFGLWLGTGFGVWTRSAASQRAHFGFMRWWLGALNKVTRSLFHLKVVIEDRPTPRPGPILVFCRHAGPGNSMILIGTLLVGYLRQPRIVMLAKLQWEPLFDTMLNRLPNRFIRHDPSRRELYLQAIADLATGLGDMDAFVLFPEGKDFTPRVRQRAIERLRSGGHDAEAEKAEAMARVLPPRHNGVMAAMAAAPDADVIFVAHALLEDVGSFRELWGRIPLTGPVLTRYWRIPAAEVPRAQDDLIPWLYEWWGRIDHWIEEHTAARGAAPAREV